LITLIFTGMPVLMAAGTFYWTRGRGGYRPLGAGSLSSLLLAFSFAFATYSPLVRSALDGIAPDLSRLLSNAGTLTAAGSVLAFLLVMDRGPEAARNAIRWCFALLAGALGVMLVTYLATPSRPLPDGGREVFPQAHLMPVTLELYTLVYVLYLAVAAGGCLRQTWAQAKGNRHLSRRVGLRITAVGCGLALVYALYKTLHLVGALFHTDLVPESNSTRSCTSVITQTDCALGVATPMLSVLLIAAGLLLPALAWPVIQMRRRRWEAHAVAALEPLWTDLTAVASQIVLLPEVDASDEGADYALHRRVVEIADSVLELRPHRSLDVADEARRLLADVGRDPEAEPAVVEAAVLLGAVHAARFGRPEEPRQAPAAPNSRSGDLHAETDWLLAVAAAYTGDPIAAASALMQSDADLV